MTFRLAFPFVLPLALAACAHEPLHATPSIADHGNLVLVGGGAKPPDAVKLFVDLAGGKEAKIVVLPLASADSREAGADYVTLFGGYGVTDVTVIQIDDRRDALRRAYAEAIDRATGVFFGGGDQSRIASRIVDTPILDAVRALKARGGVVGGTSAGTACQSAVMLTGDGDERSFRADNVAVTRGIGLFEGVIVDSHFVARRRYVRLQAAVLDHPGLLGVGVDEATAAWVKPDGTFEVVGRGEVVVYDGDAADRAPEARAHDDDAEDEPARGRLATGMKTYRLRKGDRFDLHTRRPIAKDAQPGE